MVLVTIFIWNRHKEDRLSLTAILVQLFLYDITSMVIFALQQYIFKVVFYVYFNTTSYHSFYKSVYYYTLTFFNFIGHVLLILSIHALYVVYYIYFYYL